MLLAMGPYVTLSGVAMGLGIMFGALVTELAEIYPYSKHQLATLRYWRLLHRIELYLFFSATDRTEELTINDVIREIRRIET